VLDDKRAVGALAGSVGSVVNVMRGTLNMDRSPETARTVEGTAVLSDAVLSALLGVLPVGNGAASTYLNHNKVFLTSLLVPLRHPNFSFPYRCCLSPSSRCSKAITHHYDG
jgi:hypothetical protein